MRRSSVLFDPGWLFLIAGLALIISSVLVPASYDLWVMRSQQKQLAAQERENDLRLQAYARFLSDLDSRDPQLVRRLAASQLNRIPKGESPVLLAASANRTPIEWVDASVQPVTAQITPFPDSLLSRLTLGRKALWVAGGGVMFMFLGLLLAPVQVAIPRKELGEARDRANLVLTRVLVGPPRPQMAGAPESADRSETAHLA